MISGYYDTNESIAYPLLADVDTGVAGLSLSQVISAASVSMSRDVFAASLGSFYISSLVRDASGSAIITVADSPSGSPRISIAFRVQLNAPRFSVIRGTVTGSIPGVALRCIAFIVVSTPADLGKLAVGQSAVLSTIAALVPAAIKVANTGAVNTVAVVNERGPAVTAVPIVNSVIPGAVMSLDRAAQITENTVVTTTDVSLSLSAGIQVGQVQVPALVLVPGTSTVPIASMAPPPAVDVGGGIVAAFGIAGVPSAFVFTTWLASQDLLDAITDVAVHIDGVFTVLIPKANLAAGFNRTFPSVGVRAIAFVAKNLAAAVLVVGVDIDVRPTAVAVVVTSSAQMSLVTVPANTLASAQSAVLETSIERVSTEQPPYDVTVVLGSSYAADDAGARAAIASPVFTAVDTTTALGIVIGKNLSVVFTDTVAVVSVVPGANVSPPYIGVSAPASIACGGMLRTLFGASPNDSGAVTLVAGNGVTIIPEPGANRVTIIIDDPRLKETGVECSS